MNTRCRSFSTRSAAAVAIGALSVAVAAGAAKCDALAAYQIQPLVKAGANVGGWTVAPATGAGLWVDGLNDQGQVQFMGTTDTGSLFLAEYGGGALVPIALPGQKGPGGTW